LDPRTGLVNHFAMTGYVYLIVNDQKSKIVRRKLSQIM